MAKQASTSAATNGTFVSFQTSQGQDVNATVIKLDRFELAFEMYSPSSVLRTSEALTNFRIILHDHTVYAGRAVVRGLVNVGNLVVCEAKLEDAWLDVEA